MCLEPNDSKLENNGESTAVKLIEKEWNEDTDLTPKKSPKSCNLRYTLKMNLTFDIVSL